MYPTQAAAVAGRQHSVPMPEPQEEEAVAMVVEGGSSSSDGPATTLESGEPSSATKQPDAPPTHFPWGIFIFCWLGWCFDFLDLVLLGFVKEEVVVELGINARQEAWMLGVSLGTSGLGGIIAGILADRVGKRDILAVTILTYSVGSLITALAPTFGVFLFGRAVVGLGVGGEWSIGHAMVAESVPPQFKGRASAFLQTGEPVGVVMAALLGYLAMPRIGWRWCMGLLTFAALLAMATRRSLHLPNTKATDHMIKCHEIPDKRRLFINAIKAFILGVFKLGTYWTMYTWFPGFLKKEMHQGVGKSLTWVLTAQCGQMIGMLCFGFVSDSLGRRPSVSLYSVLTVAPIAGLAFRWEYLDKHKFYFWCTMFTLGLGSGLTAVFGALLAELFPSELRSAMMGTVYNCARGVQLLSPVVVEYALEINGLQGALSVPLTLACLTGIWVWVLPETKGVPLSSLKEEREHAEEEQEGAKEGGREGGVPLSVQTR